MGIGPRQKQVREYRGQIPSPGRPTVAWREDRVKFWAAISRGVMTEDAAVIAGVSSPVGFRWFRHAGGVNPGLPATVSGRYLSFSEREDIALARAQGMGVREIARQLGRDPSTVSRELRRNASTRTYRLDYKASTAQWHAERRARRPKTAKLLTHDRLREYVQDRLAGEIRTADGRLVTGPRGPQWKGRNKPHRGDRAWTTGWSPEQISRRLRADFPEDESMRISHEAIYQALYVQSRGGLKRELVACLRTGRALRVPRARARQRAWAHVTNGTLISERPAEVEDRAVPGHWEGDLIIGVAALGYRDLGGADDKVHDADPPAARGGLGCDPADKERATSRRIRGDHDEQSPRFDDHDAARAATSVADLGPRQGAVRTRPIHGRDRSSGVFRRPA